MKSKPSKSKPGELPLQELPSFLARMRAQLGSQDYRVVEEVVQAVQALDELHLLGLSPEEFVAAVEALERQTEAGAPSPAPEQREIKSLPGQPGPERPSC